MKHATFRQLTVFEAVGRLLSFSRAAEELHLTQPAVSTQIKKLEEHAGNALFEQIGKKVYLTAAGAELLRISRAIILQFQSAENAMMQFRGISGGRLNVGVISAGDYFFPRLLVEFVGRHPSVTLNFTVHNRPGLIARIAENLTDLAVMVRPPLNPDTESVPFAQHPYVIIAAATHPLAGEANIPLDTLLSEAFVVRERGSDTWMSMQEGFGERFGEIRIAMEIASTETIKQAVIAGMGVSFVSAHTIAQELRAASLCVLHVSGFPLMLHWHLVHKRDKRLSPVALAFKNFLLAEGEALVGRFVPTEAYGPS